MSAAPTQQPETFPLEMREYWRTWLNGRCLAFAAMLNLVPWGETQIARLPSQHHKAVVLTLANLQARCCRGEQARGGRRSDRLRDDAQRELWRVMRPWAQRGEHYVEHLVGPREVQDEFLERIGPIAWSSD